MSNQEPMAWLPSREEELVEEALAEIYKGFEQNKRSMAEVKNLLAEMVSPDAYDKILNRQFILEKKGQVEFTPAGEKIAQSVVRRCRLSERLLTDVLGVQPESLSAAACQFEHVLTRELTDSICILLGHPTECPHENPIPPGDCCKKSESVVRSVVKPLNKLESRCEAKIAYMLYKRNPDAYRLMSLGLVPGAAIKLLQRVPNYILQVGETQVALDELLARDIYVRPLVK